MRVGESVVCVPPFSMNVDDAVGAQEPKGVGGGRLAQFDDGREIANRHRAGKQGDQDADPAGFAEKVEDVRKIDDGACRRHSFSHMVDLCGIDQTFRGSVGAGRGR